MRGKLPVGFKDTRQIGEPINQDELKKFIDYAVQSGVQIGNQQNPTGGFENYCGDLDVLQRLVEQTREQLDSNLFKQSNANKIILMYDNILNTNEPGEVIDISTFAKANGRTITLNKFMYDDGIYLAKEYAEAVAAGYFPKGTDHNCVIAHETGHIIDKFTRGLRRSVMRVVENSAENDGIGLTEYITENVSSYGALIGIDMEYHELIPELNSMLKTGNDYGIIKLLRKEGVL